MKIHHIPSIHQRSKKRVAAYCRVSTDMKSQEESFETQVSYYQSYIERNDEWVLVGIYADGGVSATGAAKRPEFMRMIADAMEGKIDLILAKSISRFSRNVVDCQVYVQQLRSKGVEVRFEKERLSSLDASSEMIFSMMAAIAQDESRSISQNIGRARRRTSSTARYSAHHAARPTNAGRFPISGWKARRSTTRCGTAARDRRGRRATAAGTTLSGKRSCCARYPTSSAGNGRARTTLTRSSSTRWCRPFMSRTAR